MKKLILSLFLVLALVLTACASTSEPQEAKTTSSKEPLKPREQLEQIISLLSLREYEQVYNQVHPNAKSKFGRGQIVDRSQKIHTDLGVSSITYSDVEEIALAAHQAIYSAKLKISTEYGEVEKEQSITLIYQAEIGRWLLDWTPSLIIPGLNEYGLVRIVEEISQRGKIYDYQGQALAEEKLVFDLAIIPRQYEPSHEAEINRIFGLKAGQIKKALEQSWVKADTLVPIKSFDSLSAEQESAISTYNLEIRRSKRRFYPLAHSAAHLIGYATYPSAEDLAKPEYQDLSSQNLIGRQGLEYVYDEQLRGINGFKVLVTGEHEEVILEKQVQHGQDLHLSIDAKIQAQVYEQVKADNMAISALDPKTGEIRALVSSPSFDPNSFVQGMSQSEYDALLANPKLPLYNKFELAHTPGSTQKVLTAIAGFRSQVLSPSTSYTTQGYTWQLDESWGNYFVRRVIEDNEPMDIVRAIEKSDNIFFAKLANQMGIAEFSKQYQELGIGAVPSPDYPFAKAQLSNSGSIDNTVLLADTAYGQGEFQITQIQLASYYAAVANAGVLPKLHLVKDEKLEVKDQESKPNSILTADQASIMERALKRVVSHTFGDIIERPLLDLAGKSGTVELGYDESSQMRLNSYFIGYDLNKKDLVLACLLFNSHEYEDDWHCHRQFADIMQTLAKE